jgi:hypothetical protein
MPFTGVPSIAVMTSPHCRCSAPPAPAAAATIPAKDHIRHLRVSVPACPPLWDLLLGGTTGSHPNRWPRNQGPLYHDTPAIASRRHLSSGPGALRKPTGKNTQSPNQGGYLHENPTPRLGRGHSSRTHCLRPSPSACTLECRPAHSLRGRQVAEDGIVEAWADRLSTAYASRYLTSDIPGH